MAESNEKKNENVSDKQDNQNQIEYRVEIICNQSIQDDVIELLEQEIQNIQYKFYYPKISKINNFKIKMIFFSFLYAKLIFHHKII